jgi:tetratricopeptide (TPR) repeat protein
MAVSVHHLMVSRLGLSFLLTIALPLVGQSDNADLGADACAKCHANSHKEWAQSLHSKMMQPATEARVEGNFATAQVALHGSTYVLQHRADNYYITESELTGRAAEHHIDYTLGSKRIQHYLTTLPDGRIIILPTTWDNLRKKWVHVSDVQNPEEDAGGQIQVWNKSCYSCHASQAYKNFDAQQLRYQTTGKVLGINCESCHGPGRDHVAAEKSKSSSKGQSGADADHAIVNPAHLDATRSTMLCAQCHAFRDIYVDGFEAGANFYDFFLPVMEYRLPASENPAYWPDGRPRWLSNEAIGLWQSECFLKGSATCTSCHSNSHEIDVDRNAALHKASNGLCMSCHKAIAANVSAHTHHAKTSSGSSCVECHMPRDVVGVQGTFRDHSMSIPVPENTIGHEIPNACNLCHKDKDAQWALQQVKGWYGEGSRQKLVARADAFSKARAGDPQAVEALLDVMSDPSAGAFIRANAEGYLASFPNDPAAYDTVFRALNDTEPLIRATAAAEIRPRAAQRETAAPQLAALLHDPVATVRMSAAIGLVVMGVRELPAGDEEWFTRAKELYAARAELNSDDANQQVAAGRFFYLAGDMQRSVDAFRTALKLDSTIPAQYYLARATAANGDSAGARKILETIPANDQQYAVAQQFLASLNGNDSGEREQTNTSATGNTEAEAAFNDGQSQYRNENYGVALTDLEKALRLAPQADWATKAEIYRAICLEKLGRTEEAEAAMQALFHRSAARDDVDLQLAFAELLVETGRTEEALKPIDAAITAAPKSGIAYFWRAKILLQLHHADEAAVAAQQSVRLMPDSLAAHNLLLKIYQLQGRAEEAAHEAEWLRNYQRRVESR